MIPAAARYPMCASASSSRSPPWMSARRMQKDEYKFEGLAKGTYRLVANAPGFSASTAEVELARIRLAAWICIWR